MQDFIRIGGEIVSSPLNENFRRLVNQISLANVNLVFSSEYGIVNTIDDMKNIPGPVNGQACYVISSGELYRYTTRDNDWYKIMDIGQTFRQGFLNSGAVVLDNYITLKPGVKNTLIMPNMLVYFKNQPGDERYLKGMYLIKTIEVDVNEYIVSPNSYSIYVDYQGNYSVQTGMPTEDNVNLIYLGTFLTDNNGNIIEEFIYTLPDIAFTDDRGHFYIYGGEANGLNLVPSDNNDTTVNRNGGYYYDEGINFTIGETSQYPIDTDNGSNFNLRYYESETPVSQLIYMAPENSLEHDITISQGIICNKYWKDGKLTDVPENYFTIQKHLVTPNGQNIILYGKEIYNSEGDAVSNLNTVYGLDVNFPYIEATRIVVGNIPGFTTDNAAYCKFFTLSRLAQVGTISPKFADTAFEIYSGSATDTTPASIRFVLDALEAEDYDALYNLSVLPYNTTRSHFYTDKKYIKDGSVPGVIKEEDDTRKVNEKGGYYLADNRDLQDAIARINVLEQEIWEPYNEALERYEQSLRYRLYQTELRLDADDIILEDHENRIDYLEANKVHKATTINGFRLGDNTLNAEAKNIVLYTGDIDEGKGAGGKVNLWYTDERVSAHPEVTVAKQHADTKSKIDNALGHVKVNPHQLTTDDINILQDTTKLFVTPDEERRIRADRLPDDTILALQQLDDKNMDYLEVFYMEGNSTKPGFGPFAVGNARKFRFFEDGVKLSMDSDGETLIIECIGQVDEKTVMFKSRYCTIEAEYPNEFGGYVDNAVNAEYATYVHGMEDADPSQYYGTNKEGEVGIYDLPVYVSTADAEDYGSIEQVLFMPINNSVQERHLEESLRNKINNNYHSVYDDGELKSAAINSFRFGEGLDVTVEDNMALINATGSGTGTGGVSHFANLEDVDVLYTGNKGKVLVVNEAEDAIVLEDMPSLKNFMLKAMYVSDVDITKVKKAEVADRALASDTTANASKLNDRIVNDNGTGTGVLWTASKIVSNTTAQIKSEGVNTHTGTAAPADSLGKNGDIYVMIES